MSGAQPAGASESAAKDPPAPDKPPADANGPAEGVASGGDSSGDGPDEERSNLAEESLSFEPSAAQIRMSFGDGGRYRDIAGAIHNHYYTGSARGTASGTISVAELEHSSARYVTTPSDDELCEALRARHVVVLHGAPDTGRRESALMALDEVTGRSREASLLVMLDPAGGLKGAVEDLSQGVGHVLTVTTVPGSGGTPGDDVQLNKAREALGDDGYLVIIADSDDIEPAAGHCVAHVPPIPEDVAVFHLAADLAAVELPGKAAAAGKPSAEARKKAEAIIAAACAVDESTRAWREELRGQAAPKPAEAVMFGAAMLDWHRCKVADPGARPRTEKFRMRYRYDYARRLLRHRHGMASPVPQSYLIATAVLNGLNANDVIAGAVGLCELLPPALRERDVIFEEPLSRRVAPAQLAAADTGNGTVVRMPSPELARCVIEAAWREYSGVREPMLRWLLNLCEEGDRVDDVRVHAVQALACIAADDYDLIDKKVLGRWAATRGPESHRAAAWLLEAIVRDGSSTEKVLKSLRAWSRGTDHRKRSIALRAYGTSIAEVSPPDAIAGIRLSADMATFSVLPELALREMYRLGMAAPVMAELVTWPRGLPAARRRASLALVRIAYIRGDGTDCPREKYDLLWRLAYTPGQVGVPVSQIAGLWQVACGDDRSRKDAWRALCDWAGSCADDRRMSETFTELAAGLEKTAGDDRLRERIGKYRRWWDRNLTQEDRT